MRSIFVLMHDTHGKMALQLAALLCCGWLQALAQHTLSERDPNQLYLQGQHLFQHQKYSPSRQQHDAYLLQGKHSPRRGDAQYAKARAALELLNSDAEQLYLQFLAENPQHPQAPMAFFDLGRSAFERKDYNTAIAHLQRVPLAALPPQQRAQAQFMAGYSHLTRKDFETAEGYFAAVISQPFAQQAAANYYYAYLKIRSGKFDDAEAAIAFAEKDATYAPLVPQLRTIIFYKKKDYTAAITTGEKALQENPTVEGADEIALLIADSYYIRGNYALADTNFSQWAARNQASITPAIRYRMAYSAFAAGKTDKAIEGLKLVVESPDTSRLVRDTLGLYANYYLGVAQLKKDNKAFALTAFDAARRIKGVDEGLRDLAWFNFSKLLLDLERTSEAIDALQIYVLRFSNGTFAAEANDLIGEAFLRTSDFQAALKHIQTIPKKSPRVLAAYQRASLLQGLDLFYQKNYAEAAGSFATAIENPSDTGVTVAAYFFMGETQSELGNWAEAEKNYAAAAKHPSAAGTGYALRAVYGQAYASLNQKKYSQAIPLLLRYTQAQPQQPQHADALLRLADAYYVTKKYDQAIAQYSAAMRAGNPQADYATFQKALCYTLANSDAQASQLFQTVIDSFPGSPLIAQASLQLAALQAGAGRYQQAEARYTQLLRLPSLDARIAPLALMRRASVRYNLKQYDSASADYKRVIDQYPTSKAAEQALSGLQEAVGSTGNIEEFNEYLARYKQANPGSNSTEAIEFETAKSLYFAQKYAKAITGLKAFVESYGNSALVPEATFYLGESHFRLGQMPQALQYHQAVVADGRSLFNNRSVARLAEVQLSQGNFPEAYAQYVLLRNLARNGKEALQATLGMMDAAYAMGGLDTAHAEASKVLETEGVPYDLANRAALCRGKVEMKRGNYEAATDDFLTIINSTKDASAAEAQYLLADMLHQQQQYKQSLEALFELNKQYATFTRWYDSSFLLIAENYIKLDELGAAEYALERLVEKSPNEATRKKAAARLAQVKGMKAGL